MIVHGPVCLVCGRQGVHAACLNRTYDSNYRKPAMWRRIVRAITDWVHGDS